MGEILWIISSGLGTTITYFTQVKQVCRLAFYGLQLAYAYLQSFMNNMTTPQN